MMTNPHSLDISLTAYNETFQAPWVGKVELDEAGKWFDDFMLLVSGVDEIVMHTESALNVVYYTASAVFTRV